MAASPCSACLRLARVHSTQMDDYLIVATRARNLNEALAVLGLDGDPEVRRAAARRAREKM
jgi:hypothetical protein